MTLSQDVFRVHKEEFDEKGVVKVDGLLSPEEVQYYRQVYDMFLSGEIDCKRHRHDLGGKGNGDVESITQIMWPSDYYPELRESPIHIKSLAFARALLGDDMSFDFDMLIDKSPNTNTPTPWHQDQAYWPDMPDKRALSVWVALDFATVDNGCMWYVPGSHKEPVRQHWKAGGTSNSALQCECSEAEGKYFEIPPGTAVAHHGKTLHYSRGNTTDSHRRAYILNFRPGAMVEWERERGFDHNRKQNKGNAVSTPQGSV